MGFLFPQQPLAGPAGRHGVDDIVSRHPTRAKVDEFRQLPCPHFLEQLHPSLASGRPLLRLNDWTMTIHLVKAQLGVNLDDTPLQRWSHELVYLADLRKNAVRLNRDSRAVGRRFAIQTQGLLEGLRLQRPTGWRREHATPARSSQKSSGGLVAFPPAGYRMVEKTYRDVDAKDLRRGLPSEDFPDAGGQPNLHPARPYIAQNDNPTRLAPVGSGNASHRRYLFRFSWRHPLPLRIPIPPKGPARYRPSQGCTRR